MSNEIPEQVAYILLKDIMTTENRTLSSGDLKQPYKNADRKYLLDTYAECLNAVRQPAHRVKP